MNKVIALKTNNPRYWDITVANSQYNEAEILTTLAEIDAANAEWEQLVSDIYANVLTDELGEMGYIAGYASESHGNINKTMCAMSGEFRPSDKQNGQDGWPVRKWQKEVKRLHRDIKKLRKMVENV